MLEKVVVTASLGTFPGLAEALAGLPLAVEERPLLSFSPPSDWALVDVALDRLSLYGAVAFTSPRAAAAVADRIALRKGPSGQRSSPPPVWAAGPATAAALRDALGPVRLPAEQENAERGAAEALAAAMIAGHARGPVLFPCGETRREELPERLRGEGIEVDEVVCYRSILAAESAARAAALHAAVLVVASPSVAHLLSRACPQDARPDLLAVGPSTAASARSSGWYPAAVASKPSAEAVAAAVRTIIAGRIPHE
ncbi:MAG TPA: uroporphyrinogen-III synthase [Gemmatimonadales bacterium]|nr:uroporphyrinogen-III synthase [Gemmatimonadales bacterium]